MKKLLLVFLFLMMLIPARASHIVGGEFELLYISGNTYRINLILYFDRQNGSTGARDPNVTISIFRMSNNGVMMNVLLPLLSETEVVYSQPECSIGELQTTKLIYSSTVVLSATNFSDPQGYYLAWERCCRNYTITNIFSEPPESSSRYAGQTFYLEFPPVMKGGVPFINSSPRLFPPLSDYACKGKPYYVDFSGTDDDGDSLVYSLVTPLNTKTSDALPPDGLPRPRPYPDVVWRAPYSFDNIIGGAPDLEISSDGLLTVTPQNTGLFVFAVKCEEFRDGVKIGEARRDFQMLSVQCKTAVPPLILGKKLTDTNFAYKDNMMITFDHGTSDQDRCIVVRVSDKDINNNFDSFMEKIKIRAIGIGNKQAANNLILPQIKSATLTLQDSVALFEICFVECPGYSGSYQIGIIASDDACALPLLDTLRITVNPTPNVEAYFVTTDIREIMEEGEPIRNWDVNAVDEDGDLMSLSVFTEPGVNLSNVGMNFDLIGQSQNTIRANFSWDPKCNIYNFRTKTEFEIKMVVRGTCIFDTMTFNLKINLPDNSSPIIDNTLSSEKRSIEITKKIYETVNFNVLGDDADNDPLILSVRGLDFNLNEFGATFPQAESDGSVNSQFNWLINCDAVNLQTKDYFEFRFIVVDSANYCHLYKADTLDLQIHIEPPDNLAPQLQAASTTSEPFINGMMATVLGQPVSVTLKATDFDTFPEKDSLTLRLINATGNVEPLGFTFSMVQGESPIEGIFTWQPDCSIFQNGVYENKYTFSFAVSDDRCFNSESDTVEFDLKIVDVDGGDENFIPPNVFSPNGDGKNDFFAMVKEAYPDEFETILPNDNCLNEFINFRIYDRWGKQVFESFSRDFRWYAEGMPVGVYYYYLKYSNRDYKGVVSIRF